MIWRRTLPNLLTAAVLLALAALPREARASEELRTKIADLAKEVLKNTKNQPVKIGQFTAVGVTDANAGPGLEQVLARELEALQKGSVRAEAKFEVHANYALVDNKTDGEGLKEVRLTVRIFDKDSGEELVELRKLVRLTGNNSLAEVLQITASLPPAGSKKERNKELVRRAKDPAAFIHGPGKTLISSAKDSPYAVELLVNALADHGRRKAQPREASAERTGKKGLTFVDIRRDELYEVKLYNKSAKETAVALTINGLDMFHFSRDRNKDGRPRFTHFIMPPRSELTVVGWHNTIDRKAKDNFLSFLVSGYGAGAVSKAGLPSRGGVGVIHVQFAHCRPLAPGVKAAAGNETGFGPPREVKQEAVRYEIDPPHDFVTVRYTR